MRIDRIHSGFVLGVAALLAPTVGVFAPLLVTPIALFALLGQLALRVLDRGGAVRSDRPLIAILAAILGWSVLSLIWTADREDALTKCASIVLLGLLASAAFAFSPPLAEHERHALRRFVLAGIAIGFALIFFEMTTSGTISRGILGKNPHDDTLRMMFTQTSSVLFLFLWPAVAILWRSWPLIGLGVILVGFVAAYFLPGTSASIAFAIGAAFFFVSLLAARGARIFLATALAAAILAAPFVPQIAPALDPASIRERSATSNASLLHRLDIWSFTIGKIAERPLIGWGFNSSRAIPGGGEHYQLRARSGEVVGQGNRLPLHPHNGALQAWLELGLPGALGFAALFALAALRTARQTDRAGRAAALGAIATAAPIWFLSFGIWQTWWLAMLIFTTMLMAALVVPSRT